jgi:HK97 gp10 family phage protein
VSDNRNITGGRELDAFLQTLSVKVEKNIMRSALRQGANAIKDEAKANVPVHLGELRKSIRVTTSAKGGRVSASVKAGNRKAFYWHFVEFGTAAHNIAGKKGGSLMFGGHFARSVHHPGAVAKPFMRPALDAKADAALAAVAAQIRKRLTAEGINTPAPEGE